jgi:putative spermidine/putrescine transport system substrate-binding protein
MEILHSDEGQLAWMKGYAHGVQQTDLEARGVIPADIAAKLPSSAEFASAVAPTDAQVTAAKTLIVDGWMKTVGVDIPTPAP